MPETVKVEKTAEQIREEAVLVAFPGLAKRVKIKPIKCDVKEMVQLKVSVGEDGKAYPDEGDVVDLDALIQTYKDQCGMEGAKRMLKQGLITPEELADDGKSSYDGSVIPETAQDRANAAVAAQKNLDSVKAMFGIEPGQDLTDEQVDALIKSYIEKNLDKFVAKSATEPPKDAPKGDQ